MCLVRQTTVHQGNVTKRRSRRVPASSASPRTAHILRVFARRWFLIGLVAGVSLTLDAQQRPPRGALGPVARFSQILGRPTDRSVALSLLSAAALKVQVEYGTQAGSHTVRMPLQDLTVGVPFEFTLTPLQPDTRYYYRVLTLSTEGGDFRAEPEGTFHTQRAPGATFAFALQGDSHPEREGKMYDPVLYTQTLKNVAKDAPDFYLTMGDDFSIERLISRGAVTQAAVDQVYALQRTYLGLVARSAALFLMNGNHEQAALCNVDGTPNSAAVMAGRARLRFYPLPEPDGFYGGNAEAVPLLGRPRDYYSWTWGDALFVVIDPYWHSTVPVDNEAGSGPETKREKGEPGDKAAKANQGGKRQGGKARDLWQVTLGDAQYQWLARTLTESPARWKFVFCHHVLGTGRGGIEEAGLYEWGGRDRSGRNEFAAHRPGWPLAIHPLMVQTGVTIFFQGHDHLYARQDLDGVVYQSCPNPADPTYTAFNRDAYKSGVVLPNSGHLRVTVGPEAVRVDYVRAFLPADETSGRTNAAVASSYLIQRKTTGGPR